jgi:pyrimidine operon attenuation protein/uracil phosphoribosyltransferase
VAKKQTVGSTEIHAAIGRLAAAISARHPAPKSLLVLGIAAGGIELARRLALALSQGEPPASMRARPGIVDISFHRDDFGRNPIPKEYPATLIPGDVHGATVILVDDVLFSGRTVKAALDELFDHGRPATVELAVLVDRGGRTLPIAPTYTGLELAAGEKEKVRLHLDQQDPRKDTLTIQPA